MIKRILKWTFLLILIGGFVWFEIAYWSSTNNCDQKIAPTNPMKAIVYCDYGLNNLKLAEIEKPTPTDEQVLVRVRAASINPYDWHFLEGSPKVMRGMIGGLRKPKDIRLGVDFAGVVEAAGKNVTQFKVGDEVFGGRQGALGEYVCVKADRAIAHKPAELSFEQAASINIAGLTALQGLRDKGKVQSGQKVLINGASGGVGTFAVQLAKIMSADVTGVCSTRNVDLVKSLGADHVIDYTKEDFTKGDQKYDAILDNVANRSLSECRKVLTPNGRFVLIGGGGANEQGWIGPLALPFKAMIYSWFVSQKMGMMMAETSQSDLTYLAELIQSGKLKPVIDRTYKLSETKDAMAYLEEGHARGKVVITLD
ncbi:MAG TPA: NAD(P)-dependent alcohol dehydrogenase [Chthoniobacterales bacterium]|nr:NAD(P)-dependent alcohol dehydrogenase [Chthoniobacterales bacterium]